MKPQTAKIFVNGGSQAVRLPKPFRFQTDEVLIKKVGDDIILSPRPESWDDFFTQTALPSDDFMADRRDLPPQERKDMF
ncbi:Antitoxin VapB2 [Candidatus Desulfarcum epimagneticum]|uniref:Antitoxin VapB2 n=1 Tax=uncultured Desulfobacteraceae bacterium TaxID=218296 RepID=A0A484HFH1_9BACT|nr:Antitoxin VapB2 [uncultured Desulfobacteraceae bacterium]